MLWKAEDIGYGWSTVTVGDGGLFITGDQDDQLLITALNRDGAQRWQVSADQAWTKNYPGSRATVTVDEDRIYLLSAHGVVSCRSAETGDVIWDRQLTEFGGEIPNWGYSASVPIYDDLAVVVPGGANFMVALDKMSGQERWSTKNYSAHAEYCTPIVVKHAAGDFFVAATKEGLVGVDAKSGEVLWENRYSTGGGINAATPLYSDGYLFWPNGHNKGAVCLKIGDDRKAEQVWQTDVDAECHLGDFIAHKGYLYGHHDRSWKCFHLATGEEAWSSKPLRKGALCFADGMLYLFQESRGLAALATCSPSGIEVRGKMQVKGRGQSWAHPVVAGGRLYLRYARTLYCFDVRTSDSEQLATHRVNE